ncbi:MAG TPA: fatty acid--CoA ligase family protein [Stackebrandtia sp.]|uniref:class I adenylate-forming enzyme family protein n=1 Tax=Stackebrandtia sp. TaxID=2023065 RepID=UPI002D4F552A|nr:fatty acid--CoA ligase family protein [Stackebrandtia sp.]HZE37552.1 fatty acid--CoA ligase family protein [Stackebrandtia sp.]
MDVTTARVFPQELLDSFADSPHTVAFEHAGRRVTRGELLDLITRYAGGLRQAGLGAGSGLAVATAVTPEGFAALIAGHLLGCRVVGVRPGLSASQLPHVVGRDVDALVADAASDTDALRAAAGATPRLALETLASEPEKPVAQGNPLDTALVSFTSGSTAAPKGAAFSYAALSSHWAWQKTRWTEQAARLAEGYQRFLLFGTLTSAVMQEHMGLSLMAGGTAVIPDGLPVFPQVIEELRITAALQTVPRLHHVLDTLDASDVDISSLRKVIVAGSPLAPHRLAEAHRKLGTVVHHGYGQTETGMLSVLTSAEVDERPERLSSVGRVCDNVELEVRDGDGDVVAAGTTGELWVRAATQLSGYWRNPAETADLFDATGWVRTRDLGHVDADGYVYLTGRARDIIIVNAIIHYAGPIEQAIASHPDVDQAYVVGAPDEHTGEAAHAFVVDRPGRRAPVAELRRRVAAALGEAAVPSTFTFVDAVPVAPSGKPDKKALLGLRHT